MLIVVIVLAVVCLVMSGLVLYFLLTKSKQKPDNSTLLIKEDLTQLSQNVLKLKDDLNAQLTQRLDKSHASVLKQMEASGRLIANVTERLTKLDETNKRVVDVADELKTLQNVLQNPKQRGVLGEYYLEQILKNMLPPGTFKLQYKLGEGMTVDAVILLEDKLLPIDSKFSLENYNRLVEAKPVERPQLEKVFKEDLKRRIDETAKYIQPRRGTLDQALMFIPSEAIYYDLLANKVGLGAVSGRDLMQYAAVDKKVSIVGPSTLSAMLQIIIQGLRSLEIQKDTEQIRKNVEQLGKHIKAYDGYMQKMGSSLRTTVGHFNTAHKELGKMDKDVIKIAGVDSSVDPLLLDKPTDDED